MKANPDIIRDFARLQADAAALSKSNLELAQKNAEMRDLLRRLSAYRATPMDARLYLSNDKTQAVT